MRLDVLILGSGAAGLSAAIRAAQLGMHVGVLTKGELTQSATRWAQGGVAAVLGGDEDSTDQHLADTLAAGAGLCDVDAVRVLVDEGPARVNDLIALGAVFDRDTEGSLLLAREGGHSHARVVHAGGAATGAEIERALVDAVRSTATSLMEEWFALDLLVEQGRCAGVLARSPDGAEHRVEAAATVLAAGGAGQMFAVTTNPREATGDGTAVALRAGVPVADVEFMQFHPTALHHPAMPRPLLSEALRGHGAILRDSHGERFIDELLPRDQVSRAMTARMLDQGVEHLWLDATGLAQFDERFPTIAESLRTIGLDPARDWLPIAPAAHYFGGGVVTDLDGASALPGLWACGEAACTGVHGANRLASNSLLECMVFAQRVIEALDRGKDSADASGVMRGLLDGSAWTVDREQARVEPAEKTATPGAGEGDLEKARTEMQRAMTVGAGVLRSAESLARTRGRLEAVAGSMMRDGSLAAHEMTNLLEVAGALLAAATAREESRGAHTRIDHPETKPSMARRIVLR